MAEASSENKSRKTNAEDGAPFLRVSLSSLVAILFLTVAAIGMAYIGGVMSGRHMGAETARPEIAEKAPGKAPEIAEKEETGQSGQILAAEELEFARVLRNEKVPALPKDAPAAPAEIAPAAGTPAPGEEKEPQSAQPPAEAMETPPATEGLYDYIFQLGVFKDEGMADKLRQSLEGYGLRTQLRRSGKLYVVRVLLRGDPSRAAEIGSIAGVLKLGPPLEVSRRPVVPGQ